MQVRAFERYIPLRLFFFVNDGFYSSAGIYTVSIEASLLAYIK